MDIIEIVRSANASACESIGYGDIENAKQHLYYATECLKQIPEGAIDEALVYSLAASLLNNWGMISLQSGSYDAQSSEQHFSEAINKELKALELQPGIVPPDVHAQTLCNMSVALSKQGKYKESVFHSKMAIATLNNFESWDNRIRSLMSVCQYNLAVALEQQGEMIDAMTAYKTGLDMNPLDENFAKVLSDAYNDIQTQLKKKSKRSESRSSSRAGRSRTSKDSRSTSKPPTHASTHRDSDSKDPPATAKGSCRAPTEPTNARSSSRPNVNSSNSNHSNHPAGAAAPPDRSDTFASAATASASNSAPQAAQASDPTAFLRIATQPTVDSMEDALEESITADHTFLSPTGTIIHVRGSEIAQRNPFSSRYSTTPMITPLMAPDSMHSTVSSQYSAYQQLGSTYLPATSPLSAAMAASLPATTMSNTSTSATATTPSLTTLVGTSLAPLSLKSSEELMRRFLDPNLFPSLPTPTSATTPAAAMETPTRVRTAPSTSFASPMHQPRTPSNRPTTPGARIVSAQQPLLADSPNPPFASPRPSTAPYHSSPSRSPFWDSHPGPGTTSALGSTMGSTMGNQPLSQTLLGPALSATDTLEGRVQRQRLEMWARSRPKPVPRSLAILQSRPAWDNNVKIERSSSTHATARRANSPVGARTTTEFGATIENGTGSKFKDSSSRQRLLGSVYDRKHLPTVRNPNGRSVSRQGHRGSSNTRGGPGYGGLDHLPPNQPMHQTFHCSAMLANGTLHTTHNNNNNSNNNTLHITPIQRHASHQDLAHTTRPLSQSLPRPLTRSNTLPANQWPAGTPPATAHSGYSSIHPHFPLPQADSSAYYQYPVAANSATNSAANPPTNANSNARTNSRTSTQSSISPTHSTTHPPDTANHHPNSALPRTYSMTSQASGASTASSLIATPGAATPVPATAPRGRSQNGGGFLSVSEFMHNVQVQAQVYAEQVLSRQVMEKDRLRSASTGSRVPTDPGAAWGTHDAALPSNPPRSLTDGSVAASVSAPVSGVVSGVVSGTSTPGSATPRPTTDIGTHLESAVHQVFDTALRSALQRRSSIASTSSAVSGTSATSAASTANPATSTANATGSRHVSTSPVPIRTHSYKISASDETRMDVMGITEARKNQIGPVTADSAGKSMVSVPV